MSISARFIFIALLKFCSILFLVSLAHCASGQVDFYHALKSKKQFVQLQSKPLTQKFSNTKAVKVIYDIQNAKLYFTNSEKYHYHHDFCREILFNDPDVAKFNYLNYKASGSRKYILGTINYYQDQDVYALEFATSEHFSMDNLLLYNLIRKNSFIGNKLFMNPITDRQASYLKNVPEQPRIITSNELYRGVMQQLLVPGSKIGILRKIDIKDLKKTNIQPTDIVLTNGSPNEIDLCAGLIITRFQSPLSHINVLCQNRKTPVLALKTAYQDFDNLTGKYVRFSVNANNFVLEEVNKKTFEDFKKNSSLHRLQELKIDTLSKLLLPLSSLKKHQLSSYGGKAINTAELFRVFRLERYCKLPERAFAIPIVYYTRHFQASGADKMINEILNDTSLLNNKVLLEEKLKAVRKKIKSYSINKGLLKEVNYICSISNKSNKRFRFRSSTNAEDIAGFNGAGLYNSCTGILDTDSGKTIERAIKKVWASTWTERAFREREYFGINQRRVGMGVLVHNAFGEEEVNGVAITKNMYRSNYEAFTINVQKGEVSIVDGKDTSVSELFLLYDDGEVVIDHITYSSLNNGKSLLTKAHTKQLYEALNIIKRHYYYKLNNRRQDYNGYGLDVEFKVKDGKLIIKQVRPFSG